MLQDKLKVGDFDHSIRDYLDNDAAKHLMLGASVVIPPIGGYLEHKSQCTYNPIWRRSCFGRPGIQEGTRKVNDKQAHRKIAMICRSRTTYEVRDTDWRELSEVPAIEISTANRHAFRWQVWWGAPSWDQQANVLQSEGWFPREFAKVAGNPHDRRYLAAMLKLIPNEQLLKVASPSDRQGRSLRRAVHLALCERILAVSEDEAMLCIVFPASSSSEFYRLPVLERACDSCVCYVYARAKPAAHTCCPHTGAV